MSFLKLTCVYLERQMIFIETPSNPCSKVSDIVAISKLAHSREGAEIIVAIDNTLLTPYFQRPLELGADIAVYSMTKYMNGHNDVSAIDNSTI